MSSGSRNPLRSELGHAPVAGRLARRSGRAAVSGPPAAVKALRETREGLVRRGARRRRSQQLGARQALEHVLLGLLPVVITAFVLYRVYADGNSAVDFQHSFWVAGSRVLHGLGPYNWARAQIAGGVSFPYPAPVALLLAPFALLPSLSAGVLATLACLLAAPLALWILGIRDWRVYGAVALWAPIVLAWQTANFTLPLVVGVAALWRWREREWVAATLVACLVSVKPIMAPLWIWLLFMRGPRPAARAVAVAIVINAVSWTVLGWHQLGAWLHLLSVQGGLRDGTGYSLIALAQQLGLGHRVGVVAIVACSFALVALVLVRSITRAGTASARGRELAAFGAAVVLTIVISPQIDAHYMALLLVPLALARPRLSWPWLAPLVLWVCPATAASWWQIALWWAVLGALGVRELLPSRSASEVRDRSVVPNVPAAA